MNAEPLNSAFLYPPSISSQNKQTTKNEGKKVHFNFSRLVKHHYIKLDT